MSFLPTWEPHDTLLRKDGNYLELYLSLYERDNHPSRIIEFPPEPIYENNREPNNSTGLGEILFRSFYDRVPAYETK